MSTVTRKHPMSWWVVVVSGGLVMVFGVAIIREMVRTRQIRDQLGQLRSQISSEEQRHEQLKELIAYLSSPTFQEREARLQLGLKKSGERVILVPTDENGNSNASGLGTTRAGEEVSGSIPSRWWQYFFSEDLHKSAASS